MVRDSRTNKHDTANIRSSPLPSSPSSISKKRSRFDPSNAQHTNTASTGQHRAPASDDNLDSSSRQRKRSKKDSDHTVTSSTLPSDNAVESSTESLETVVSATTDDKSYSVPSSHHGAVGGEDGDMAKAQRKADAMAAEARRALKGKQKAQIAPELQPDDHDKDDDETRSKASRAIESVRAQLATKDTVSCRTTLPIFHSGLPADRTRQRRSSLPLKLAVSLPCKWRCPATSASKPSSRLTPFSAVMYCVWRSSIPPRGS